MTDMNRPEPIDDFETLPPRLREAFGALRKEQVLVPERVDAAVRAAAREHLGARKVIRFSFWPLAAAAAVTVSFLGIWLSSSRVDARADLNHDGRVDVLDAFALARKLQNGERGVELDANGDGVVDERDVQAVVALAVKLGGPRL